MMVLKSCAYCPSGSRNEEGSQLFQVLAGAITGPENLLIVGDFNLPKSSKELKHAYRGLGSKDLWCGFIKMLCLKM